MSRVATIPGNSNADLTITDASIGAQCAIGVTPGQITDDTNSGTIWVPTLNDPTNGVTPINVQFGLPLRYPIQNVTTGDTWVFFKGTIDTSTGFITALEIDTGTTVPASTNALWYSALGQIVSTVVAGKASVKIIANSRGSKEYKLCGPIPVIDGTGYVSGVVGI